MKDSGIAHMGIGMGKGENAAQDAVRAAIESPLLETSISGAENVLLNITGGTEFSLVDMGEVSSIVREMVSQEATIIVGTAVDENMKDEIKVTLIATGLNAGQRRTQKPDFIAAAANSNTEQTSNRSFPRFQPPADNDNDVFVRTVKPGMNDVNVPSFLRKNNN